MNPLKASAQFAAYVWYTEVRQGTSTPDEARGFAGQNWRAFLTSADAGWGQLLLRLSQPRRAASGRRRRRQAQRPPQAPALAGVN
jgi:hypothetical protein